MNDYVYAIAVSGSGVYAGGGFTTAGGVVASHIAKWDGTSWSALGSGMNEYFVRTIVASGSEVYTGGYFTTAGAKPSSYFGRYSLNQPPITNAGSDQTVIVNETVQLDGSGSSDPDGDPLTYAWEITSKPAGSNATLSDPSIVNPTFVADMAGEYSVSLVVNDGTVNSAPDEVIITAITAQQVTQNLIVQVQALNKPQLNGLIGMLKVVIKRLNDNRIDKAIEMLQQFIDHVENFIGNGILTRDEGQPLIDAAEAIIAALSNPTQAPSHKNDAGDGL
ncbi:PKD domain-containing protein, partial [bacterium]|nr:PKD domain-containing protein [bacterium]